MITVRIVRIKVRGRAITVAEQDAYHPERPETRLIGAVSEGQIGQHYRETGSAQHDDRQGKAPFAWLETICPHCAQTSTCRKERGFYYYHTMAQ